MRIDSSRLQAELDQINLRLASNGDLTTRARRELAQRRKSLELTICGAHELQKIRRDIEELNLVRNDSELQALAAEELSRLEGRRQGLEREIWSRLAGADVHDERNAFMEIRAGVGGEEAALFAADLFRLYQKFVESCGLAWKPLDVSPTGLKGISKGVALVSGSEAYRRLKWESGIHRVQRVPRTESSGRIHTSTVTVAVLPEAEPDEVEINPKDLKIDTFRAGGHGGQNVNKVETAVRITHVPSGTVVACQEERSQFQNREKAMRMLLAKLAWTDEEKRAQEKTEARRQLIKGAQRSEKIRTYNFMQSRVTDHRTKTNLHNVEEIMNGKIGPFIEALEKDDLERRIAAWGAGTGPDKA